jgi:tRNA threonylcarbamoyladenosine biosynthesis protein TsaB
VKKAKEVVPTGMVLGIETATALGGVALVSAAGELLAEVTLRSQQSHAERIVPTVGSLLETLGASPADLAAVVVSRGPGSFTGLRAGIASAKGLAFSLGVPLYGISTLEALAANLPPGAGPVCAVLNARRGVVFRALFHLGPAGPQRLGEDDLVAAAAFADELPAGCIVVGEVPDSFLERRPPAPVRLAPAHLNHPRAAVIATRGRLALASSRDSQLDSLAPWYLRPPDTDSGRRRTENARTDAGLRCAALTPGTPSASMRPVPTGKRERNR